MTARCEQILSLIDQALADACNGVHESVAALLDCPPCTDLLSELEPAPAFTVDDGPSLSNRVRLIVSAHAAQYHLDDPVRRLVADIIRSVESDDRA